jgi:hypothetical protein
VSRSKQARLYLPFRDAEKLWQVLAGTPSCPWDREFCFFEFEKMIRNEDLEQQHRSQIFHTSVLVLDPTALSAKAFKCFDTFYAVRAPALAQQAIVPRFGSAGVGAPAFRCCCCHGISCPALAQRVLVPPLSAAAAATEYRAPLSAAPTSMRACPALSQAWFCSPLANFAS